LKEYAITSRLGWWPDTFVDIDSLARDLCYNRHHYPHVEFVIKERETTPWVESAVDVPMLVYSEHFAHLPWRETKEAEDGAFAAWLASEDD